MNPWVGDDSRALSYNLSMVGDLLSTKMFVPTLRSAFVPRPHLVEQINLGLQAGCKLTLISAPAGFGKTTLVSEWANQKDEGRGMKDKNNDLPPSEFRIPPSAFRIPPSKIAWLSLDERDNDPSRFLTYFAAALQKFEPSLGEPAIAMLHAPQPPAVESVLTSLLNDIAGLAGDYDRNFPYTLVLDDYHLIDAGPVHEILTFLLDNMPPNFHLVLIGRSDPPLPLSRLRALAQMTEIRQAALRFTAWEANVFLTKVMGLSLSAGDLEALERRTEGWIVGLQLAAVSMQGREDLAEFVAAFSGSHRFIMDYLAEEVLRQQEEEVRRFLYQTVILNPFTASLCEAITERNDCQTILTRLEQDNVFIVPLDDERRWYRYHHLFAGLLRQRLEEERPDEVPALHCRAAAWYEEHGHVTQAIDHWLAGGESHRAARLIEAQALPALNRGEMSTVIKWLESVPLETFRAHPWLGIARAWTALLGGRFEGIEADLENALRVAAEKGDETDARPLFGHAAAIRAYFSLMMGDVAAATGHAQEALERLPVADASTRSVVTYTLGGARLMVEDMEGACDAFADAGATAWEAGNIHLAPSALGALGALQFQMGRLHLALDTFDRAQQMATSKSGRALPIGAGALNGKGIVFYEWDDLDAATIHLEEALGLAEMWGNVDSLIISHLFLARVRLAQGDVEEALGGLQKADRLVRRKRLTFPTEASLAAEWLRTLLAEGDLDGARRRVEERGLRPDDRLSYVREVEYLALARVLLAQNELEKARTLLGRLRQLAESGGRLGRVIEMQVLQALTFWQLGEVETAVATLEQALCSAEQEGYVRTFLDEGLPIRELLERVAGRDIIQAYAAKLLTAFPSARLLAPAAPGPEAIESLTEHELKVLRLVAAGLSNRQVGDELYLSTNTVKWHLKNIYEKLDVHSRVAAIARAQELGFL